MAKRHIELTKYEIARLIGARALQLGMGAPPLVEVKPNVISAVEVAKNEFDKNVIPLQVL